MTTLSTIKTEAIKLRCVKCGRTKPHGGWIGVNVYDKVVGRGRGVECGRLDCKPIEGSPYKDRMHWYRHFFTVISKPDYFATNVYDDFWNELIDNLPIETEAKRAVEIKNLIESRYLKPHRKWYEFWK